MRSGVKHSERGYTLAEILTVVAIIGLLSMVSIPAFINFRASNTLKSAMNGFINDIRYARQYSITHTVYVRIVIDASGATTNRTYSFQSSADYGSTWTSLTAPGSNAGVKTLPQQVWFVVTNGLPTSGSSTLVEYRPSGGLILAPNATVGQIGIGSTWSRMAYDRYGISLTPSGNVKSQGAHS